MMRIRGLKAPSTIVEGRNGKLQAKKRSMFKLSKFTLFFFLAISVFTLLALALISPSASTDGFPSNDISFIKRKTIESDGLGKRGEQWTEIISWEPRVSIYHNFLSKEECMYLISLAKPHMVKSTVVDRETGKSVDSRYRTSFGMFLKRGRDKIIRAIEKRIAAFTFIPVEHGEALQILHYEVGQKYDAHHDFFVHDFNIKRGGQRTATLLMYLSDVEEGGETVFPAAKGNFSGVPWRNELSKCGKVGLFVKPKMGNALLFWSMKPDATLDSTSLHGSCPVIRGNKWSCTKWMHLKEF